MNEVIEKANGKAQELDNKIRTLLKECNAFYEVFSYPIEELEIENDNVIVKILVLTNTDSDVIEISNILDVKMNSNQVIYHNRIEDSFYNGVDVYFQDGKYREEIKVMTYEMLNALDEAQERKL